MPQQSPLRLIKRWRQYAKRDTVTKVPPITRGVYILYRQTAADFGVYYIGIGGLKLDTTSAVASRLRSHAKHKEDWSHYSVFEVHDNVTHDEIRELEALLLGIFRHDSRIKLSNTQLGSKKLGATRVNEKWEFISGKKSKRKPRKQKPK
jgi:hypothetical protein